MSSLGASWAMAACMAWGCTVARADAPVVSERGRALLSEGLLLGALQPPPAEVSGPQFVALTPAAWAQLTNVPEPSVRVVPPVVNDPQPQREPAEVPFPNGLGMGLAGLALVLGSNTVRRFRLNVE